MKKHICACCNTEYESGSDEEETVSGLNPDNEEDMDNICDDCSIKLDIVADFVSNKAKKDNQWSKKKRKFVND